MHCRLLDPLQTLQLLQNVHLGTGAGGVYAAGAEGLDTAGAEGEDTVSETEPARARLPTEPRCVLGEFFHDPLARGCHLPLEAAPPPLGLETRAGADGDETAGAAGAAGALPPLQNKSQQNRSCGHGLSRLFTVRHKASTFSPRQERRAASLMRNEIVPNYCGNEARLLTASSSRS